MRHLQYGLNTYIVGPSHDDFNLHHWLDKANLSHYPIALHDALTDEEIQAGFNIPFDVSKYQ